MATIFSNYISGFTKIIKEFTPTSAIHADLDGLILYSTSLEIPDIVKLRHFNNSFFCLGTTPIQFPIPDREQLIIDLWAKARRTLIPPEIVKTIKTIKVVVSEENQATSISKLVRTDIEEDITSTYPFTINPLIPDTELWFVIRRENIALCGIRITDIAKRKYKPQKGELRPELANILCLISQTNKDDVVLDPFAGTGAIARELVNHFPYKKVIVNDHNENYYQELRNTFMGHTSTSVIKSNALRMKSIESHTINKIITDPPWGYYMNQDTDFNTFYKAMLVEFDRILVKNAVAIILTARKDEFVECIIKSPFEIVENYNILVSGKKAGVYVIKK